MGRLVRYFSRLTEGVAAMLMAAMFVTFLIQITVRYVVGSPVFAGTLGQVIDARSFGWTLEFCLVTWLWIVFWGNAFIVRDRDHVTFDLLYLAAGPRARRWMAAIGALVIVVAFASSILPTWEKLRILRLKSSATLPVKMLPIYSVYFAFLAAVAIRYAVRLHDVLRHGAPAEHHHVGITDE